MGLIRPATPGFLVTLTATILLAVVSFSVPYFKSIFFLKASLSVQGVDGSVTFGALGYCLTLANGTSCSKPSIGYEFDINALVGDKIKFAQIPTIAVKWITYVLFLHVVALILAAISAAFGLLAHVREMAMTCCSSCISGFAATAAFFAFVLDLVFFFLARSRLNAVKGGSAQIGLAIWLTLAAWALLFFSGCFYAIGRCCVSRRPSNSRGGIADKWLGGGGASGGQDEVLRLQAVKAEADRKALAQRQEGGLPTFHEYERGKHAETVPLTARVDGDEVYVDGPAQPVHQYAGGYAPAPAGTRTVDSYADARRQPSVASAQTTYPPQPQPQPQAAPTQPARQASGHAQAKSGYATSNYGVGAGAGAGAAAAQYGRSQNISPDNQYLAANSQYGGYQQQPGGVAYGHGQDNTSYHSAQSHAQQPSSYSVYDPYAQQQTQNYYSAGQPPMPSPPAVAAYGQPSAYGQPQQASAYGQPQQTSIYGHPQQSGAYVQPQLTGYVQPQHSGGYGQQPSGYGAQQDRSYTLGGSGYGASVVPSSYESRPNTTSPGLGYMPHPGDYQRSPASPPMPSPPHINTRYQAPPLLVASPTELPMGSPPRYDGPLDGPPPGTNYGRDAKR